MLKAIDTKVLLAILTALMAIGVAVMYQRDETEKATAQAAKAAAILEQQRKQYEAFRQQVERERNHHSSAAAHEGKTWQKYIP